MMANIHPLVAKLSIVLRFAHGFRRNTIQSVHGLVRNFWRWFYLPKIGLAYTMWNQLLSVCLSWLPFKFDNRVGLPQSSSSLTNSKIFSSLFLQRMMVVKHFATRLFVVILWIHFMLVSTDSPEFMSTNSAVLRSDWLHFDHVIILIKLVFITCIPQEAAQRYSHNIADSLHV